METTPTIVDSERTSRARIASRQCQRDALEHRGFIVGKLADRKAAEIDSRHRPGDGRVSGFPDQRRIVERAARLLDRRPNRSRPMDQVARGTQLEAGEGLVDGEVNIEA